MEVRKFMLVAVFYAIVARCVSFGKSILFFVERQKLNPQKLQNSLIKNVQRLKKWGECFESLTIENVENLLPSKMRKMFKNPLLSINIERQQKRTTADGSTLL